MLGRVVKAAATHCYDQLDSMVGMRLELPRLMKLLDFA